MNRLRIAAIVEGHGEVQAIRTLLWRTWTELLEGEFVGVIKPIRRPRSKLLKKEELERAIHLALLKLAEPAPVPDPTLVLVLLDAHDDPPCELGPALTERAKTVHTGADVSCVVANVEYETWFVAAAESLSDYLVLPPDESIPVSPEEARLGKGWIDGHFKGTKYSETIDQPAMTAKMDLAQCRERSPSFDKLCRELEARLTS